MTRQCDLIVVGSGAAGLAAAVTAAHLGLDVVVLEKSMSGLYSVGNDMASIFAGRYPAGGITLGPAMTFGYSAAHHAAGVPLATDDDAPRANAKGPP